MNIFAETQQVKIKFISPLVPSKSMHLNAGSARLPPPFDVPKGEDCVIYAIAVPQPLPRLRFVLPRQRPLLPLLVLGPEVSAL